MGGPAPGALNAATARDSAARGWALRPRFGAVCRPADMMTSAASGVASDQDALAYPGTVGEFDEPSFDRAPDRGAADRRLRRRRRPRPEPRVADAARRDGRDRRAAGRRRIELRRLLPGGGPAPDRALHRHRGGTSRPLPGQRHDDRRVGALDDDDRTG